MMRETPLGPLTVPTTRFWSLHIHLYLQNAPHPPHLLSRHSDGRVQPCGVHYGGFYLEMWPELHPGASALIPKAQTIASTLKLSSCLWTKSDETFLRVLQG